MREILPTLSNSQKSLSGLRASAQPQLVGTSARDLRRQTTLLTAAVLGMLICAPCVCY